MNNPYNRSLRNREFSIQLDRCQRGREAITKGLHRITGRYVRTADDRGGSKKIHNGNGF